MAPYNLSTSTGIAALNAEVTRQAQMVAYIGSTIGRPTDIVLSTRRMSGKTLGLAGR